ncbi:MAG: hypothetical protein ACI4E2_07290 [Acetatifactor sp.]
MFNARNIAFLDIVVHGKYGWFFNVDYNAIFKINLVDNSVELEAMLPDRFFGEKEAYAGIEYYNGKLYLAPRSDRRLCVYCLNEKTFSFFNLELEKYGEENNYNLFSAVKAIGGNIYFFPGRFRTIVKMNPVEFSIEYIDYGYNEISRFWDSEKGNLLIFNRVHFYGNRCVMPCWRTNCIVEFDCAENKFRHNQIECAGELADAILDGGQYVCSFKDKNYVVRFNPDENKVVELFSTESKKGNFLFSHGKNIYVIPLYGRYIEMFIQDTQEKSIVFEYPAKIDDKQTWLKYQNCSLCNKLFEDKLIMYSNRLGEIVTIYLDANSYKTNVISLNQEDETKILNEIKNMYLNQNVFESESYGLNDFLDNMEML